ncbi:adenosine 5'-monophosphoramidase HINT3 isoform X1 [Stomoxys calcitrans]|uniref:Adenosine 5'-monophosphoramidase HINT3 n=1 Tax=Stomoxys calcitrans TaxID=35570 RepID=A0A1I8Q6K6_STOCA|nr:adenosine 5'-monophosphoramidase HINT3 isoform X1 [Stomoxys calcitrans]
MGLRKGQTDDQFDNTMKKELLKKNAKGKQIKKYLCCALFTLAIVLPVILYKFVLAPPPFDEMAPCIFCEIAGGRSPNTQIEVETDEYVIFKDIKPASTHHYLAVPKRHIESLKVMTKEDIPLVDHLEEALKQFFKSKGIDTEDALFGFHMPPFISVRHLHMHGIAPRSTMSWMNSFVFKAHSAWFKLVEDARKYLENK